MPTFLVAIDFLEMEQHRLNPSGFAGDGQVPHLARLHQPSGHLADSGLQQLLRQPHPLRIPLRAV